MQKLYSFPETHQLRAENVAVRESLRAGETKLNLNFSSAQII